MALSRVCFGGLNAAWWRYLFSAALDGIAYALQDRCLVFCVSVLGVVLLRCCNGNIPFIRFIIIIYTTYVFIILYFTPCVASDAYLNEVCVC